MGLGKTYSTKYLADSNNNIGAPGQVLSTTSTGIDWVDANTVPGAGLWLESGNDIYNSNSGNVAIGATSSSHKLLVSSSDNNVLKLINEELNYGENQQSILFQGVWWNGNPGALTNTARIAGTHRANGYHSGGLNFYSYNNGAEVNAMTIIYDGNVGIGTNSPDAKLHVESTTATGANFILETTHTGGIPLLDLKGAHSAQLRYKDELNVIQGRIDFGDSGTFNFIDVPNNNSTLYLKTGGNVGIGTTSPGAKLDIEAGGTGDALGDSTTAAIFRAGRQNVWFQNQRTAAGTDWNNNTFKIIAKIDTTSHQSINFVNDASYNEHIDIYTGNQAFSTRFASNGNVGIGTTSPDEKLSVDGNIFLQGNDDYIAFNTSASSGHPKIKMNSDADFSFLNTAGSNIFHIENGGNVGIGTSTPNAKLDIQGTQGQLFSVTDDLSGDIFSVADISGVPILNVNSDGTSYFDGNVGIGTDSPGAKLEVLGNIILRQSASNSETVYIATNARGGGTADADLRLGNSNNGDVLTVHNANVGIGTTSPTNKLDVNGTFRATGTGAIQGRLSVGTSSSSDIDMLRAGGNYITATNAAGVLYFRTVSDIRMAILANGNVGIGTTNPSAKLQVYRDDATIAASLAEATSRASVKIRSSSTDGAHLAISQGDSGCTQLQVSSTNGTTPRNIKIQPFGGNVGIGTGTANPSDKLVVVGNVVATNFVLSSDERKKTKIKDLTCNNIDVNWRSFELKQHEGEYRTGVIAQELEQSHPEFVKTDNEGFKSVKYIDLLIAKIAELEARLEKLEK